MHQAMLRALMFVAAALPLVGAACDTVDLGPPPADVNACRPSQQFFNDQIWPNFLSRDYGGKHCSDGRCHDAASAQSLKLPPPTSPPAVPLPSDWFAIYKSATEQMHCTGATTSPLLIYPDGQVTHGGGTLIAPDGPEAALVEMWVTAP